MRGDKNNNNKKPYWSVKPCSLGETHTNKVTQTKTEEIKMSTLIYE